MPVSWRNLTVPARNLRRGSGFRFGLGQASVTGRKPIRNALRETKRNDLAIDTTPACGCGLRSDPGRTDIRGIRAVAYPPRHHARSAVHSRQRHRHDDAADGGRVGKALGQQAWLIDDRPGANGIAGGDPTSRARRRTATPCRHDEHDALGQTRSLMKQPGLRPMKELAPIAPTGNLPFMLVIDPGHSCEDRAGAHRARKADPGSYTYAYGLVRRRS